jgi:hypothetical protein
VNNLYNLDDIHKKLNDIENEQEKILNKLRDIEFLIPNHQSMRLAVSEGIIIGGIFLFIFINGYNYLTK